MISFQVSAVGDLARPRRSDRVPGRMPVTLLVRDRHLLIEGFGSTVDLSRHGFRVQTELNLNKGQDLVIFADSGRWRLGRCRVVWSRPIPSLSATEAGLRLLT